MVYQKNTVQRIARCFFVPHQGVAYPMLQHTGCAIFGGLTAKNVLLRLDDGKAHLVHPTSEPFCLSAAGALLGV